MIMAAFIMDDGYRNYEYIIYFLIYMCIALEQGIFFDLSDGGVVFLHSMLMNIPVLIWTIVYMITNRSLTYVITSAVMITSFIITMYSVLSYIGSRYEHLKMPFWRRTGCLIKQCIPTGRCLKSRKSCTM